ncbi:MFS transporter [Ornithinimicrobium tianjinense]|uniref:MFS transporter n=1 Tax=Ornithinimicrobium tianjinense TaxID=1195761 RepID=A0A917BHP7_9MICO|nr:MFS transporter [Ornithinimicrobium tianjinense]GGF41880.1 MFS transporter [Ornithinimicrobium tianjinense]
MSPVQSYRQLFALTGPLYVAVAFLGRIPLAMSQIASLLAVSAATGSYAAGGVTAGALAVANAVGAPLAGALSDRLGQRPVLLVQSVLGTLGLAVLALLTGTHEAGSAWWPLPVVAALGGAFVPQVGTMARVRWRPISRASRAHDPRVMDAAFSYEGAADEASFVLGPALVGVIAAVAAPVTSLVVAAVLLGAFGTWFAVHPTSSLVGRAPSSTAGRDRLLTPALLILAATQLTLGMLFGSVQTGTSVLATQAGQPGLTGLLHGLLGVGSVLAGLAVVAVPERVGYPTRLRWFTLALVVLAVPLLAVDGLGTLAVALLGLGFAVAPTMITTFTLAERLTPARRLGAAMTLLAAATGTGYAVGAALAGRLADLGGHRPAFAVTVGATVLALGLALAAAAPVRRAHARPGSAAAVRTGPQDAAGGDAAGDAARELVSSR